MISTGGGGGGTFKSGSDWVVLRDFPHLFIVRVASRIVRKKSSIYFGDGFLQEAPEWDFGGRDLLGGLGSEVSHVPKSEAPGAPGSFPETGAFFNTNPAFGR
jgi:hypothetical protein